MPGDQETPYLVCCEPLGGCEPLTGSCVGDNNGNGMDDACEETGACCDPSTGACTPDVTETDCDALHGTGNWYSGQGCSPNPCPQPPPEACCYPDGTCGMALPSTCLYYEGRLLGPGSSCSGNTYACCHMDDTCEMTDVDCCTTVGGTPQDPDEECTEEALCCLPGGQCTYLDPLCCDDQGGGPSPSGEPLCLGDANTNGIDDACEEPQEPEACCLSSGTCTDVAPDACVAAGGNPRGPGTECATADCTLTIDWHVIAGGGITRSTGGNFELSGTIGQPVAGSMSFGDLSITGGFWHGYVPGDCDGDGDVDLDDFTELATCLEGPGSGLAQPSCNCFDLDSNGDIDLFDFAEFQVVFTGGA